jgi:DNA repair exonuclease SbcCD ATPase subunit
MAIKNFQHMNQMVERYTRLSQAYVTLAERFNQLDVEHMQLKGQMVTLLKACKVSKPRIQALEAEKVALEEALEQQTAQHRRELQNLTQDYEERLEQMSRHLEELRPMEMLASDEAYQSLTEAEEQMELIETTLKEMEVDSSPDLTRDDKALLLEYQANPTQFLMTTGISPEESFPAIFLNQEDADHQKWQPSFQEEHFAEVENV